MEADDIGNIYVELNNNPATPLMGIATITLKCGVSLSCIRIYPDKRDDKKVFLSFPTRPINGSKREKLYYPYNNETRIHMTNRVHEIYLKRRSSNEN